MSISTSKPNFFGKGSVVVPSYGEKFIRRLAISADRLVERPIEGFNVIPDAIAYAARRHANRDAVGWRDIVMIQEEEKEVKKMVGGQMVTEAKRQTYFEFSDFKYISFLEVKERVSELARGLLHYGLLKTDVFNIFAQTSANWQLMSLACSCISTPVTTAYDTLSEAGLKHSLNEPDCVGHAVRLVVYDGEPKSVLLGQIREVRKGIAVVPIDQLRVCGQAQSLEILEPRKPTPEDVALIMYTSGSTDTPKGVVLTHANVVASIGGIYHLLGHHLLPDDRYLAYLPLAHILEYMVELVLFTFGVKIGYGRLKTLTDESVRRCRGDLVTFRPTFLVGVPQVWEKIRKAIVAKVDASGTLKKNVFYGAIASKMGNVFSGLREVTGGRLRLAMNGGGALSRETQEFLSIVLAPVLQGYGLTESSAMCTLLPPELMQYGSVGLPLPCIEIALIDVPEAGYWANRNPPQGEVCIRGPAVTKGYYKRPDLNEDETIFTRDGWLRTRDIGQWNPDGTLSLIDRIQNLVELQGGEYIALEHLEATYKSCTLVANICIHASTEAKQPIAIIVPHEPNLRKVLAYRPLPGVDSTAPFAELCHDNAVRALVLKECNIVGKRNNFKPKELLEAVILTAEEWSLESGFVTSTQKVQRRRIVKHFGQVIKTIYKNYTPPASMFSFDLDDQLNVGLGLEVVEC